jgi:uncharacterized protein with PQ loop repeat
MKVFKALIDLDDKIVGVVNDAYLWVYDWTGVYVATVVFIVDAPEFVHMINSKETGAACIFAFFLVTLVVWLYYGQMSGNYLQFNKSAEWMQRFPLRWFFIGLSLWLMMGHALLYKPFLVVLDVLDLVYWFVICVKIRDRNKKTFELFVPKVQHVPNA